MPRTSAAVSPEKFTTFGDLLRFLRRKADLTQRELSIAVGYSESQISRLEQNERAPDEVTLAARFVPALYIEDEPQWVARLLELGAATHAHTPNAETPQPIAEAKPTPHNLPIQLTSFIGRENEIIEIKRLLSESQGEVRLLTLTGHGGCGKTRLALQAAAGLLESFSDGVWLIELAPLTDPALVPGAVASVLGLKEEPGYPLLSTLTSHLGEKKVLIILDNCEHLVQAGAQISDVLLHSCPNLHMLATSREMLGVAGERAFYVPSLGLPGNQDGVSVEIALQSEAVRLFIERANAIAPNFVLVEENMSAVVRVCEQLDGIPLAIELATARLKMMPVQQIADRIDDAFRLLTGGIRTAMPRHQTLQALMDWSYNLLTQFEKILFRRLAVFAGGWTVEAAERVCVGEDIESAGIFDLLAHLVDKSLVRVQKNGEIARYSYLETVRQYALTKLAESGESDIVRRRHAEYYISLTETDVSYLGIQRHPAWLFRMELEYDNLRAVLSWTKSTRGAGELGLRLTEMLSTYWYYHGSWNEGRGWMEGAMAHPEAINFPHEQAQLYSSLAIVLSIQGDYETGEKYVTRSLSYFREIEDRPNIAWTLHWLGLMAREHNDAITARDRLSESVAIFQKIGDESMIAISTNTLSEAIILQGDIDFAKTMLEGNLALVRKIGDVDTLGWTLNHLGHVAQLQGEYKKAIRLHEESLGLFRQLGAQNEGTIWAHQSLGETGLAMGDVVLADRNFTEALLSCQELGHRAGMAWCLAGLAGTAALNEEPERAAWLWGAAEALRQSFGTREAPASHTTHERLKAEVGEQLGEAMFDAKWAEGQAASVEQAIAEGNTMTLNIDLTNYRALVTGVSSGIGAGIADVLAQAGSDVAGCGLEATTSEGAKRFVATVEGHGRRALYQSLDIADANKSRSFVHWAAEQLGGLDILVSNAGRNFFKGAEKATDADWESNINLNLAAHWRVAQAAKPYLDQARAPVIIIITSNHSLYTIPNSFPYNVAKAGLVAMVQSMAIEWGPHLRAVGVAPGFVDTPLADAWFNEFPDPAAKRKQIEELHPVGRLGTPNDVGALCAFLCSPLAGNISGNTILIDGGRNAVMQDV